MIKKGLEKILSKSKKWVKKLMPFALASALYFYSPAKTQTIEINPFVQPNDTTLAYYGSGDLDNNNSLNQQDLDLMLAQTSPKDQADTDGDSISFTPTDYNLLSEHINNDLFLPQNNWSDSSLTREQRQSWIQKMVSIDKTDTIPFDSLNWNCVDFSTQLSLNFMGFNGKNIPEKYFIDKNGRFNLPIYKASIFFPNGGTHDMNASLIGENPPEFNDWCMIEPQTDEINIKPGTWNIPYGSKIILKTLQNYKDNFVYYPFLTFKLDEEGNATCIYQDPNLVLERPKPTQPVDPDTTSPEIYVSSPKEGSFWNTTNVPVDYFVSDSNFKKIGWKLNDGDWTWSSNPDSSFYMNVPEGKNKLEVIAEDESENTSNLTRNFTTDKTNPLIEISSPKSDSTYKSLSNNLEYLVTDENLDSCWYSLNDSEKMPLSNNSGNVELVSKQGENVLKFYGKDKSGNLSSENITFDVDTTSSGPTKIENLTRKPNKFELNQNYPNPFNSSTTIKYSLPKNSKVSLKIYDIQGREVENLVDKTQSAGKYNVLFDAGNYSSGVYFYKLQTNDNIKTGKMILVK